MKRFGSTQSFAVELNPLSPSWERRSAGDRGPWAAFSLWVNGKNLTENVLPGERELRGEVNIPLAPIADWLVRAAPALRFEESPRTFALSEDVFAGLRMWASRTAAREERDRADDERWRFCEDHLLSSADTGSYLPRVAFVRIEDRLFVSWSNPDQPDQPSFVQKSGTDAVLWDEARGVFSSFVAWVAHELAASSEPGFSWAGRTDPFGEAIESNPWAALELGSGLSLTDALSLFDADSEQALAQKLGGDPAESVALLALRDVSTSAATVNQLLACERDVRSRSRSGALAALRNRLRIDVTGLSAEEQGKQAARWLRREWNLDGQPIADLASLLASSGVALVEEPGPPGFDHMLAGAHLEASAEVRILSSPRTKRSWSRRMETCRGLGHLLLDASAGNSIGAGSSTRTARNARRRRSGAFAAELLLPESAMRGELGDRTDAAAEPGRFEALLTRYGVGARTAAHQLFNAGLLSSELLRDDLIDEFAAPSGN